MRPLPLLVVASLALLVPAVSGAKILCLFGFSGKSHTHVFGALTSELARRGHDITVVSPFPVKDPPGKFRHIDVPTVRAHFDQFDTFIHSDATFIQKLSIAWDQISKLCPDILAIPEVKNLLNEHFDLVFVSIILNECCIPFAYHNNAPLIMISPSGSAFWTSERMGNPEPSSYVPSRFLPFSDKMTFLERAVNMLIVNLIHFARTYFFLPHLDAVARDFFGEHVPPIAELERNVSLALFNTHVSINHPRPLLPNTVEVGGMHIDTEQHTLPKDIQEFLDGAAEGAIYFSMGSTLHSDRLPPDQRQALLEAFSELPQRVLVKWESDTMPGQPANVKLGKWLPQQDILAHPNVRLFITHGGLLSTQEAAYHGVPLVGIPVFGDQALNMRQSELLGFAVSVDLDTLTNKSLLSTINQVLHTPSYTEAAKTLMARVRDQPQTPLDRAVFWTEYVIRHKGAPHLRSAALDLAWYQLYQLDLAAAMWVVRLLAVLALRKALVTCWRAYRSPKATTKLDGTKKS